MNSKNPGPSAPNKIQAVRNLAALVEGAAGQQERIQHMARVHNALAALQSQQLHDQWGFLNQKVTSTRQEAHESAQRSERARQQGQPPNVQQFERNRARVMAEEANNALRERAQFEDHVIRGHQEALVQFLEPRRVPVYRPQAQNVPMDNANANVPPPSQELTIAQLLANIHYLCEVSVVRAHQQGEQTLAAIRAREQEMDEQRVRQEKIIEFLQEIRDQNRGGRAVVVAQTPVRFGAPAGPASGAAQDKARFKQMVISAQQAATALSLHQQQQMIRHFPKPAPVNLPLPVTAQDTSGFKLKIPCPLQAGASQSQPARTLQAQAPVNLPLPVTAQDTNRFKVKIILPRQAGASQSQPARSQVQTPVTQLPSSSTAENGGAQVSLGTPAVPIVAGGGPIRQVARGRGNPFGRPRPSKKEVEHKGEVVGMGQALDPITGNYAFFSCIAANCPFTTGKRQNMAKHSKKH